MEKYLDAAQQGAMARAKVASALRQGNWNDSVIVPSETDYSYQAPSGGGSAMDSSGSGKAIGGMIRDYLHPQQVMEPGMTTVGSNSLSTGRGTGAAYNVTSGDSSWLSKLFGG